MPITTGTTSARGGTLAPRPSSTAVGWPAGTSLRRAASAGSTSTRLTPRCACSVLLAHGDLDHNLFPVYADERTNTCTHESRLFLLLSSVTSALRSSLPGPRASAGRRERSSRSDGPSKRITLAVTSTVSGAWLASPRQSSLRRCLPSLSSCARLLTLCHPHPTLSHTSGPTLHTAAM